MVGETAFLRRIEKTAKTKQEPYTLFKKAEMECASCA